MIYSDLVGIPFDEFGDSLKGTNCYNLMRMAMAINGVNVPPTNIAVCASRSASNQEIEDHRVKNWTMIDKPVIGCAILITSLNPNFANHIGTYVGENRILHITLNTNSIIERLYPRFKDKVIGFFQYTGDNTQ